MELDPEIKLLVGTISFEDLEGGYWALTDTKNNEKYLMIDIPGELKAEDTKIAAIGQEFNNEMSIYMVGKAVKLIQYRILK
ncbi:MAG: hypothetical protein HC831_03290 [Chloroflexia bacterium]|nr:hypothetical protein [Chloroflexia bacterium]